MGRHVARDEGTACHDCPDTPEPGKSRCAACAANKRAADAARRAELKRKRICWVGGCGAKCAKGLTSCEAHRGTGWRAA